MFSGESPSSTFRYGCTRLSNVPTSHLLVSVDTHWLTNSCPTGVVAHLGWPLLFLGWFGLGMHLLGCYLVVLGCRWETLLTPSRLRPCKLDSVVNHRVDFSRVGHGWAKKLTVPPGSHVVPHIPLGIPWYKRAERQRPGCPVPEQGCPVRLPGCPVARRPGGAP